MAKARWQWVMVPALVVAAYAGLLSQRPPSRDVLDDLVAADDRARATQRRDVVAWGELCDGRMIEHYARAGEALSQLSDVWSGLHALEEPARFERFGDSPERSAWRRAMRELSMGAHARDAAFVWGELRRDPGFYVPGFFKCELALLLWEGDGDGAARLTLDVLTMLLDCAEYMGDSYAFGPVASVAGEWTEDRISCLSAAPCERLAAGLRVVEPRCGETVDLRAHFAGWTRWSSVEEWTLQDRLAAWEHGFDPEARMREVLRLAVEHAPALHGDMATVELRVAAAQASLGRDVGRYYDFGLSGERARRRALAAVRSLRAALEQ